MSSYASCRLDPNTLSCLHCYISLWLDNCAQSAARERKTASLAAEHDVFEHHPWCPPAMPATPPSTSPSKRKRPASADDDLEAQFADNHMPRPPPRSSDPSGSLVLRQASSRGNRGPGDNLFAERIPKKCALSSIDLLKLRKPIKPVTLFSSSSLPPDMCDIYERVQRIEMHLDSIASGEAQSAIQDTLNAAVKWPAAWFKPQSESEDGEAAAAKVMMANRELKALLEIMKHALRCVKEGASEAAWNLDVHGPLLKLVTSTTGVSRHLITNARIEPLWLPHARAPAHLAAPSSSSAASVSDASSSNLTARNGSAVVNGKIVDFALALDTEQTPLGAALEQHLFANWDRSYCSAKHTTYGPLVLRPIGVSIETKTVAAPSDGRGQLWVWTAAWFRRMQDLVDSFASRPGGFPMIEAVPVALVTEHSWMLSFFCDRGETFEYVGEISMGDTRTLVGLYKLLANLRILIDWMETTLRPWFSRLFHVASEPDVGS